MIKDKANPRSLSALSNSRSYLPFSKNHCFLLSLQMRNESLGLTVSVWVSQTQTLQLPLITHSPRLLKWAARGVFTFTIAIVDSHADYCVFLSLSLSLPNPNSLFSQSKPKTFRYLNPLLLYTSLSQQICFFFVWILQALFWLLGVSQKEQW